MPCYDRFIKEFRQLPTPLLIGVVAGRVVFGFGLGTLLATVIKGPWKVIGWLAIAVSLLLALPGGCTVLKRARE